MVRDLYVGSKLAGHSRTDIKAKVTLVDHRVREPSASDLTKSVKIWTSLPGRIGNYEKMRGTPSWSLGDVDL